jgi:uncharacterized membrane-anchored protein YjiN (DUF445 family)
LGAVPDGPTLHVVGAGFEAAVVGGLADWFAVTALFRHPLGLPIPHTAIIPARRDKIIESIVKMIEQDWLSPDVIGARLDSISAGRVLLEWMEAPEHAARVAAPVRDLLRSVARLLTEEEVVDLLTRTLERQVGAVRIDASAGAWLARVAEPGVADGVFATLALSLAKLAERPRTAEELRWWLDRSAETLRDSGRRLVPFLLRRNAVQERLVDAACSYASTELRLAADDPQHPLRTLLLGAIRRFAERLQQGEPEAMAQAQRVWTALAESLQARPLVRDMLGKLRDQLDTDLAAPDSALSALVERRLRETARDLLHDDAQRATFDRWVRDTLKDLVNRHHEEIGKTVRENLEQLETGKLVEQIEDRVGNDLQYIRLNGAVVGGLIGVLLALVRWATGS